MHYIASGTGQNIQSGQFQAINEAFTTLIICCKFQKKTVLNSYFIRFSIILYMPGQGQITLMG